jgi:hypothetical protein
MLVDRAGRRPLQRLGEQEMIHAAQLNFRVVQAGGHATAEHGGELHAGPGADPRLALQDGYAPDRHVILEAGDEPRLRLIERDPVEGARPSATLLFGTLARAGLPSVGAVLTGIGVDGAKGLKLMRDAGCVTMVQDPSTATVSEAPSQALAAGATENALELEALAEAILSRCNQH